MKSSFSFTQTVFVLLLTNGLLNHVIVIPMLLDSAKRDAWISVLFSGALYLLWIGIIYFIYHRTNHEHLLLWVKTRYSSAVAVPIMLLLSVYCFMNATVTIKDTVAWVRLAFAPETPLFVHSLIFTFVCLVNALIGIRSIAMTSSILLPLVVILGFFVTATNQPNKDYSLLQPFLENGLQPVWQGMIYTGTGFTELILFLLIKHHLRTKISYLQLLLLGMVVIFLTLGPTIGAIVEFGPSEAAKLRYPAYEEWRLASIGLYIEHLDFLSIFQWFSGAFTSTSLSLYLIVEMLLIQESRRRTYLLVGLFCLSAALSILPIDEVQFYRLLKDYLLPIQLSIPLLLSLVLAILTAFIPRRKNQ